MTDKSNTFHGSTGSSSSSDKPPAPAPSLAERARTLMHVGGTSSLATVSHKHDGYPFCSMVPYAIDQSASPIFLISQMATHTKNVRACSRATLLVTEASGSLGGARISVMGETTLVEGDALNGIAEAYLAKHPESKQWVDFADFGFYRMAVKDVYFIGGFGSMGWVTAEEYTAAEPDPLADSAKGIIEHMNDDHVDSMLLLIEKHLELKATTARMTSVDRYGFNVRITTDSRSRGGRIGFPQTTNTADEVRQTLIKMLASARG